MNEEPDKQDGDAGMNREADRESGHAARGASRACRWPGASEARCARSARALDGPPGSSGFTLLEIMVVVFILGLLATIVAPKIMGRTDEARRTKAVADMKGIEQALNLYRLDTGSYPTTEQGLDALVHKPERPPVPRTWNPNGYLDRMPVDPWGTPYVYLGDGGRFTLKSYGADGAEGGEGKFADLDSHDF